MNQLSDNLNLKSEHITNFKFNQNRKIEIEVENKNYLRLKSLNLSKNFFKTVTPLS